MSEFFVDIRCLVDSEDITSAVNLVRNELSEYILSSCVIKEHDVIKVEIRRDDFYD